MPSRCLNSGELASFTVAKMNREQPNASGGIDHREPLDVSQPCDSGHIPTCTCSRPQLECMVVVGGGWFRTKMGEEKEPMNLGVLADDVHVRKRYTIFVCHVLGCEMQYNHPSFRGGHDRTSTSEHYYSSKKTDRKMATPFLINTQANTHEKRRMVYCGSTCLCNRIFCCIVNDMLGRRETHSSCIK